MVFLKAAETKLTAHRLPLEPGLLERLRAEWCRARLVVQRLQLWARMPVDLLRVFPPQRQ